MMNINEIIGRVQSTIGDLEGERVQRGEYLKMLQDIGISIAQKTESWVNRQIITPVGTQKANGVVVATTNILSLSGEQTIDGVLTNNSRVLLVGQTNAQDNGVYVTSAGAWVRATDADTTAEMLNMRILITQGTLWANTLWSLSTQPLFTLGVTPLAFNQIALNTPSPGSFSLPYSLNPFRIQQVYRKPLLDAIAYPCTEFSIQAVNRQVNYGYPFDVNDVQLPGEAFAVFDDTVNQALVFYFVQPFSDQEQVIIDFATDNPFGAMAAWGDNTQIPIPNYLIDTFYYGLLHRAIERMMVQGDISQAQSLTYVQQQYETKLREAMTWNLMLKDKNSTVVHQSYKFLPDGDFF